MESNGAVVGDVGSVTGYASTSSQNSEVEYVEEVTELKSATSRTFLMSDGSYRVITYPFEIAYEEEGELVGIDNSLISAGNEYENSSNYTKIKFAKKSTSNKLVDLQAADYKMSWFFIGQNKVSGKIDNIEEEGKNYNNEERHIKVKNISSSITYEEIYENIDVRYINISNKLKEDIVLKNEEAQHSFLMEIDVGKLSLQLNEDNSISAVDEKGKEIYNFAAPYMIDSSDNISHSVAVELSEVKKGVYHISLTGDSEWLASASYPVILDPTVATTYTQSNIQESYCVQANPLSTQYGAYEKMAVGMDAAGKRNRAVVRFVSLPAISDSRAIITKGTLRLTTFSAGVNVFNNSISVHKLNTSWSESSVTWNSIGWGSNISANFDAGALDSKTITGNGQYNFDITSAVKSWYAAPSSNYGVVLKYTSETSSGSLRNIWFATSDWVYKTNADYPYLSVDYIVDSSAPTASISSPASNAVIFGTMNIAGTATDSYFKNYSLQYGLGSSPTSWTTIKTSTTAVSNGTLGSLDVSTLKDGTYTIKLTVTDTVGNVSTVTRSFIRQHAASDIKITSPIGNINTKAPINVLGTATDDNFSSYTLDYKGVTSSSWITLKTSTSPVSSGGVLGVITTTGLSDDSYTLRLRLTDKAGNISETSQTFTIDTVGPTVTTKLKARNGNSTIIQVITSDASGVNSDQLYYGYGSYQANDTMPSNAVKIEGDSFTVTGKGVYTIFVQDALGNKSAEEITIMDSISVGNYHQSYTDLTVTSIGFEIGFNRSYDSLNVESGTFGKGWSFSYYGYIRDDLIQNEDKIVHLPDGSNEVFSYINEQYKGLNTSSKLHKTANGYQLITAENITYIFNTLGHLVLISDGHGNKVELGVNEKGYPTKVIDSNHREYTIDYTNDLITTITDPAGRVISYEYSNGYLTTQKNAMGAIVNHYDYENGYLSEIKNGFGTVITQITYYGNGQVKSLSDGKNTTSYSYEVSENGDKVIVQSSGEEVSRSGYDSYGRIIYSSDKQSTIYANLLGDIASIKNDDGTSTVYQYDDKGNLIAEISYDKEGNETEKQSISYEYVGDSIKKITSKTSDNLTINEFDLKGSLVKSEVTKYNSDESIEHYSKNSYIYNGNGTLSSVESIEQQGSDTSSESVSYVYKCGYPVKIIHKKNGTLVSETHFVYNVLGQVISQSSDNIHVSMIYDKLGNVVYQEIDSNGDRIRSRAVYNEHGQIIQKIDTTEYSVKDELLRYDDEYLAVNDAYGNNEVGIKYLYQENGDISEVKVSSTVVNYNSDNNITNVITKNKELVNYSYQANNKNLLDTVKYGNGATISYRYDDKDNILSISDGISNYSYNYETVTKEENTITRLANKVMSDGLTITFSYDSEDNVKVSYVKGESVVYSYQVTGDKLEEVINSVSYVSDYSDTEDVFSQGTSSFSKTYTYNASSQVAKTNIADKIIKNNTYNNQGQLTAQGTVIKGNTQTSSYTYDDRSNIKTISNGASEQYEYYYDGSNQVIRVDDKVQGKTFTYEYDRYGNILHKKTYSYSKEADLYNDNYSIVYYEYDNPLLPDAVTSYNGQSITYDEIGNPKEYLGYTMTWSMGRQLSTLSKSGNSSSYSYDDNGIRTSKTVNGITTNYTNIEGRITSEINSTNIIYYRYDHNDQLVGFNLNGIEYYYNVNIQGDIVGIVDSSGSEVVSYSYDVYGVTTYITGSLKDTVGKLNPMRYRGYYLDSESNYYYLQSRYYGSEVGRFINSDEASYIDTDTLMGLHFRSQSWEFPQICQRCLMRRILSKS